MTIIVIDGFDHYGGTLSGSRLRMLEGPWAELGLADGVDYGETNGIAGRTGVGALRLSLNGLTRKILPTTYTELYADFAVYFPNLPAVDLSAVLIDFRSAANAVLYSLHLMANGSLALVTGTTGAVLLQSGAGVITGSAWNQLEMRIKINGATSVFELFVDDLDNAVMSSSALTMAGTIGQTGHQLRFNATSALTAFWIDDLVINTIGGPYNTGYMKGPRVATVYPRLDDQTGWTAQPRYKFGNGIGQWVGTGDAMTCADSAALELASGDYTLEGFFRFLGTPNAADTMHLFSKWRESTNERSYRLFLGGASVNGGRLQFDICTNGTAGTVQTLLSAPFAPVTGRYYHIAVVRSGGECNVYVDGQPIGAKVADANTYHDNTSLFSLGGQQNAASTIVDNSSFIGFMEEVRVSQGLARYGLSGFLPPTAAFGRSVGTDPNFATVSLLLGWDTAVTDESSFGRAVTLRGNAARYAPDDAPPGEYKTVNQQTPRDDTFIEAPFTAAYGDLTVSGAISNNETVTVQGNAYTWKTVFVNVAGNVLIGGSVAASLNNLVAAINGDAGAGTVYGTGTAFSTLASASNIGNNQMRVQANTPGAAGNAVTTTETMANGSWTAATLTGGLNIPGPSSFFLGRLPPQTTGVKAVAMVQRTRKTDSGPAKTQLSFVTADNSTRNGAARAVTTAFNYYSDIIEDDPSTSAALSPSSFVGARLRVDRTE